MQCEAYLANLQAEFARKLVSLIGNARKAIDAQWGQMRAGPAQRSTMFPGYFAPAAAFTPALFEEHEAYLEAVRLSPSVAAVTALSLSLC